MKIDLTTILNGRCEKLDFDYHFEADKTESAVILPEYIDITSPVHVTGTVTDKNNCMFLNAEITVNYRASCDRCLDDVNAVLEFPFERMVSSSVGTAENNDDEFDVIFVNESGIDIDSELIEEIALELPVYHLCDENCKGLCQKCGKNLNLGPCNCEDKKEIDPRLKILQKLLDNME